jgi:hypothetical protein
MDLKKVVPNHNLMLYDILRENRLAIPPSEGKNRTIYACWVELGQGAKIRVFRWGPYIFPETISSIYTMGVIECDEPFVRVEVLGSAYTKEALVRQETGDYWGRRFTEKVGVDEYSEDNYWRKSQSPPIPYSYLKLRFTTTDGWELGDVEARFKRPEGGTIDLGQNTTLFEASLDFFGMRHTWRENIVPAQDSYQTKWDKVRRLLTQFEIKQGADALWALFLVHDTDNSCFTKGVKSTESKSGIKENLERLKSEEPVLWGFYSWIHNEKTRDGFSNNSLLSAFLEARGRDFEQLKEGLKTAMKEGLTASSGDEVAVTRAFCLTLPGAKDKSDEKRAHKEWYLRKSTKEKAIGLGVDPVSHKKLLAAIERGDIPLSVFHAPSDQLQPVNVEFDLWERAFDRAGWEPILCEIAQSAAARTKFEKDVTPYIAFLFRIEGYLDRHTGKGKKWKAFPKFVKSQWELEMTEATEEGTTKQRSALTPIPDNEARTITVPYVSMGIRGAITTYCYSFNGLPGLRREHRRSGVQNPHPLRTRDKAQRSG